MIPQADPYHPFPQNYHLLSPKSKRVSKKMQSYLLLFALLLYLLIVSIILFREPEIQEQQSSEQHQLKIEKLQQIESINFEAGSIQKDNDKEKGEDEFRSNQIKLPEQSDENRDKKIQSSDLKIKLQQQGSSQKQDAFEEKNQLEDAQNDEQTLTQFYSKTPKPYLNLESISIKQLPLCIISNIISEQQFTSIQDSLLLQNYSNYQFYYTNLDNQPFRSANSRCIHAKTQILQSSQYLQLRSVILQKCDKFKIIVLVRWPLRKEALNYLNTLYQKQNIWMTFSSSNYQGKHGIQSFYRPIFMNAINNDFNRKKVDKIEAGNLTLLAMSMLRLGQMHCIKINDSKLYNYRNEEKEFSHLDHFQGVLKNRNAFLGVRQKMFSLSQNYRINEKKADTYLKNFQQSKDEEKYLITREQMLEAIEYLQIKNLPINHSLNARQLQYFQQKYNISHYSTEIPLCIVMPSYQNIAQNRYQKALYTIHQQNYSNYHVIFIDDASPDQTLSRSQKYAQQLGMNKKVTFLRNQKQKYATFNIYHAVTNYCEKNDVVVLVDGDDELIGRYVFKLLNAVYQSKDYWIVYTNYMKSDYSSGGSRPLDPKFFNSIDRQKLHLMSPLRTFRRQLYLKIEEKDHKNSEGLFLDTLYDEALQYPLFQMAGVEKIKYVPEITYFYNTGYGNNDDSTLAKINHRKEVHDSIISRPRYNQIDTLF